MIKVLHVINDLDTGGAEMLLLNLLPSLQAKGMNCEIFMLDGKDTYISRELSQKYKVPIQSAGIGYNIYNPLIIFRLRRHLIDFDIIHAHLFPSQYWIAIAKRLFSLKGSLITTEHSSDNKRRRILIFRIFERFIYRQYRYVIAVSKIAEERIRKHLNDFSPRIRVIENGINLKTISEAEPYPKDKLIPSFKTGDKLILNVARFSKAKDHGTLIRSMTHLPENYHLLLIGEGGLKVDFMKMARELKLESRIHFLGARYDVLRILKSVDIVVMSSFYEGSPLSAIEGMASGKPFAASDVSGLNELVKDAGILFEQGNPADLAAKIILLLEDRNYAETVTIKCQEKAAFFNIERTADQYFEIYQSALQGNEHV